VAAENQVVSYVPVKLGARLLTAVLEQAPSFTRVGGDTSRVNGAGNGVRLPCTQSLLPEEIKLRLKPLKETEVCCCQQHITCLALLHVS